MKNMIPRIETSLSSLLFSLTHIFQTARTEHPFPSNRMIVYYEVTVIDAGVRWYSTSFTRNTKRHFTKSN